MHLIKNILLPNKRNGYRPHATRLPFIALVIISFLSLQAVYNYNTTGTFKVLGYASNINVGDLLASTNSQRAGSGLTAYTLNSQLNVAAQNKANHMIANDYWAHTAPDGTTPWFFINNAGYSYSSAAENLAYGFDTSSGVISGWVGSPSHAANLFGDFADVGFGIANGANFQGDENTVVVAMYGTPNGAPPPPPPTDVCTNIAGIQTSVPSGYEANGTTCTEIVVTQNPVIDVCTNLSGLQTFVPAGYVFSGTICTIPETQAAAEELAVDLCSNIEGDQATVPENYEENAGLCTEIANEEIQTETTLTEEPVQSTQPEELAETFAGSNESVSIFSSLANAPWPTAFALSASMLIISAYLFRHVVYVHNLILDGEKLVQGHPLFEMSMLYTFVAILLSASTGSIY